MSRAFTAWTAALLFILTLPAAHAAKPIWQKLEADQFVIYSDAREKDVVESALRYAAYRQVFNTLFVPPGGALPGTMLVLFRDRRTFLKHVPEQKDRTSRLVNYTLEVDGTPLNAFSLAGDRDRALALTFEFETVWALKRLGYYVPIWAAQGAGGLLSGITLRPGEVVLDDSTLSGGSSLKWERFFEVGQKSATYTEADQLGQYLAQARGLMHWVLFSAEVPRERFAELALRLRTMSGLDAVQAVTFTGADEFDRQIARHLRGPRGRRLPFDQNAVRASFRISPAPEAEVLVSTAELLVASGRRLEADANLDRARELAPDLAGVKEAWARRMFREDRPRDAVQYYRDAIAAGSRNFAAYLRSAQTRLDDNRTHGQDAAGEGGTEAMRAVDELRQAILLNPGSADAYQLLGRAFFVSPELTPEHIAELSNGVFLGEDGEIVRIYRAALFSRLGRREEAMEDLRHVVAHPDVGPRNRQIAQERLALQLVSRDAEIVEARVKAADYAGARNVVRLAQTTAEAEPAARNYARLGEWIDENEAWARLDALVRENRRDELRAAAKDFVERFPRSPRAGAARRLARER